MMTKVHLILVVLSSVVGIAFSGGCPDRKTIAPCSCVEEFGDVELYCDRYGELSLDDLKRVLGVFDTQYPLRLEVKGRKLDAIPSDFFRGFNIRVLSFEDCSLDLMQDEEGRILRGLEDTLENVLVYRSINEKDSPFGRDLSHLHTLETLHTTFTTMTELNDDLFQKGPSSLRRITISRGYIEKLGSNAFANLPNLEHLWLHRNKFGEMKRSMLPNPANHLQYLYLSYNQLHSLPEDLFTEMPALKYLLIQGNYFTVLHQEIYEKIWGQLKTVYLEDNDMDCEDSSLQWIVDSSHTPEIHGTCDQPASRKGQNVSAVIENIRKDKIQEC